VRLGAARGEEGRGVQTIIENGELHAPSIAPPLLPDDAPGPWFKQSIMRAPEGFSENF